MLINDTSTTEVASTTLSPTAAGRNGTTTSISPTDQPDIDKEGHSIIFLLVPICALLFVVFLTIVVILFLRKKRLDRLRHHLMPFYSFDPGEEEDWEAELLESNKDNHNIKGYRSMENKITPNQTPQASE